MPERINFLHWSKEQNERKVSPVRHWAHFFKRSSLKLGRTADGDDLPIIHVLKCCRRIWDI